MVVKGVVTMETQLNEELENNCFEPYILEDIVIEMLAIDGICGVY